MARNKSPGSDGIAIDFYIVFWSRLKTFFFELVQYIVRHGICHETARKGLITLLPKKGRDLKNIKSWRPIILLNSDFKVLSKILATPLKTVLNKLVASEQTGFIAGRNINENIRKTLDTIEHCEVRQIPAILIFVDFEKAFDRVEHNSLYKIMEWMNIGSKFISMVRILFNEISLATFNNGFESESFKPTRGLFQGNPIASAAFVLLIELLAVMLRKNKKIKGIKIKDETMLLTQFADDLGIAMHYDQCSWHQLVKEFDDFQAMSGMLINYDKSTIYRIGSLKNSNAKFYSSKNWCGPMNQ